MSIYIQVSVWTYAFISLLDIPKSGIVDSCGHFMLNFLRNCQTISHNSSAILSFCSSPPFPYPLFFWSQGIKFCSLAQAGVQWHNLSLLQPTPLVSSDSPASASWVAGITGVSCLANFHVLVEMRFYHVFCVDLKLLTSWSARLGLPKCWDYRNEPPCPAPTWLFNWEE